jgi:3-hydroxyacyl-[acyl-carrier-protein] dehydratase
MKPLHVHEILEYLPHRYPFMLIDRVIEYEEGKSLLAIKNVTYNEPFFTGHFPERPVMPGVLVVEALAQASGILVFLISNDKDLFYFAGIDNARFKRIIEPGDQLHLYTSVERQKRDVWKFNAKATVDGNIACSVDLMIAR